MSEDAVVLLEHLRTLLQRMLVVRVDVALASAKDVFDFRDSFLSVVYWQGVTKRVCAWAVFFVALWSSSGIGS